MMSEGYRVPSLHILPGVRINATEVYLLPRAEVSRGLMEEGMGLAK